MLKILMIEDSEADFDLFQHHIAHATEDNLYSSLKPELVWVDNLEQGIVLLKGDDFDLLMLDLNLDTSATYGIETLEAIMQEGVSLPIVVMTGDVNSEIWIEALRKGAQDYLFKGESSPRTIIKTIGYALERFKLIDELEQQSNKLMESNKELEDFAFVASHDLQEPLRKVITFGDRLVDSLGTKLKTNEKEYIDRMQKSTTRMQRLLDDLLEFSRVSHNQYRFELIDLNKVLINVLSDLQSQLEESRAKILVIFEDEVELAIVDQGLIDESLVDQPGALPEIEVDEIQISRALQNLISNSLKYRKQDSELVIKIIVQSRDDNWAVSIEDNGIGFEEEYKEKIFKQFERLHGKSEYSGTGMGLASVKKIIAKHSGEIQVKSQPGLGSTFTLLLPKKQKSLNLVAI